MNVCRMCGADGTGWTMSDWIAHRLARYAAHFPWRGDRFVVPVRVNR
jgi:hypothetical protein